ncbi:hyaluronan and proteoglycan link protein 1 [Lates calcarifer]|uniref:Hyaluronan and proteoglycan link protein 1 n=1 Tax=Lates calcarifer TaxID=8187 RepID=A0AAJ7VBN1_LATCA|nr:hyaluronan and proteoglycan link protein 1 [Lates calcarifer]
MAAVTAESLWLLLFICSLVSAPEGQNITADPGQTVTLPCRAPNTNIIVVEWTRTDLKPEYVLVYRDERPDPDNQHPSFQDRVDLVDRQMKDGDVSLTLKNVTREDTGRYKCRIIQGGTNHRKRSFLNTEPISIIYLDVRSSGNTQGHREEGGDKEGGDTEGDSRGHVGLAAGLSVVAVVALVVVALGTFMSKRHMKKNPPPPAAAAADEEAGEQML